MFKLVIIMAYVLEEITTCIGMIVKFPLRLICNKNKEHKWKHYGGGFLLQPRYLFVCKRCGVRSKGDLEDFNKKNFN